jgi:hypothetical protein
MSTSEKKTHWKKLINPDYLGAYSLEPGKDMTLTISKIVREVVKGEGGKKEECTVAYFVEKQKPMILNRTNQKTISKIHATPYIEDWAGKKITVYATTTKVAGDIVECLRIREIAPVQSLPELNPSHPKWDEAKAAIKANTATIGGIKKYYTVSDDNAKLLEA